MCAIIRHFCMHTTTKNPANIFTQIRTLLLKSKALTFVNGMHGFKWILPFLQLIMETTKIRATTDKSMLAVLWCRTWTLS